MKGPGDEIDPSAFGFIEDATGGDPILLQELRSLGNQYKESIKTIDYGPTMKEEIEQLKILGIRDAED